MRGERKRGSGPKASKDARAAREAAREIRGGEGRRAGEEFPEERAPSGEAPEGAGREPEAPPSDAEEALAASRRRVRELEAELAEAQRTIRALLDKAEEQAASPARRGGAQSGGEDAPTRADAHPSGEGAELSGGEEGLGDLMANLDRVVRQRTRALCESEEQLRRKNEELERMNAMKGEFISIAAHELRTPMTSIVGYLDLMVEGRFGELPKRLERPVSALRRNAQRLSRLVEDMLDVSRLEQGRMSINPAPCRLADIVRDVVEELAPFSAKNRQSLTTEIAADPIVHADADKIHQVVENLTASAIRYAPEKGEIAIGVDIAPEAEFAGHWAMLRVRGDSDGQSKPLRSRIFEPFSDVNSAKHHTSAGPDSAGLGLYIARGLVDLHGGLITVDSREDELTEFAVLLPLSGGEGADESARDPTA